MSPARVPLETEPQATEVSRPSNARPPSGAVGDRDHPWHFPVQGGVHLLEEGNRLEVLSATVDVRRPLALLTAVIQVEHRADRVRSEAIDVELLGPVQGVGD